MTTQIVVAVVLAALVFMLPYLTDEKTKLFRRIWSTERAASSAAIVAERDKAVLRLMERYSIKPEDDREVLLRAVAALMADALVFDLKNPRNSGVEVTQVLANEILTRCPRISDGV